MSNIHLKDQLFRELSQGSEIIDKEPNKPAIIPSNLIAAISGGFTSEVRGPDGTVFLKESIIQTPLIDIK